MTRRGPLVFCRPGAYGLHRRPEARWRRLRAATTELFRAWRDVDAVMRAEGVG